MKVRIGSEAELCKVWNLQVANVGVIRCGKVKWVRAGQPFGTGLNRREKPMENPSHNLSASKKGFAGCFPQITGSFATNLGESPQFVAPHWS